jgi:hypothetical protein
MIRLVIVLLLAAAWLDSHAQSLPECSEEKPFYEWSGCVGTYTYPDGTQYVGGFASGESRGRGTLISAKGHTLVDGRWLDDVTVDSGGGRWRYVSDGSKAYFFVLINSIRQEGAFRRAWLMTAYKEPNPKYGWLSARELSRFDCGNERYQVVQASNYAGSWGEGDLLDSFGQGEWKYTQPGTVFADVAQYVCGYKLGNK